MHEPSLLLAIDTCGPSGSVALGRRSGSGIEILAQKELAGRTYSATLVAAVADLLNHAGAKLDQLEALVAVNGPGSFTGVRVGLSAAKGLAEGASLPILAVSRLEVLSFKSSVPSAALDAHRGEVFLRLAGPGMEMREILAGASELAAIENPSAQAAVCDEAALALLGSAWPATELVHGPSPTAADALHLSISRIVADEFSDLALLDGHYLRRSDAEIFGEPGGRVARQ